MVSSMPNQTKTGIWLILQHRPSIETQVSNCGVHRGKNDIGFQIAPGMMGMGCLKHLAVTMPCYLGHVFSPGTVPWVCVLSAIHRSQAHTQSLLMGKPCVRFREGEKGKGEQANERDKVTGRRGKNYRQNWGFKKPSYLKLFIPYW